MEFEIDIRGGLGLDDFWKYRRYHVKIEHLPAIENNQSL